MNSQGKAKRPERKQQNTDRARVVNLRAWKVRRRMTMMRGRTSLIRYIITQLSYLLVIAAGASAVLSCIPSAVQMESILWTWLFGVVGAVLSLVLYALYETKRATRFLTLYLVCLGASLLAAVVLVK